jgi:hypothetical protein
LVTSAFLAIAFTSSDLFTETLLEILVKVDYTYYFDDAQVGKLLKFNFSTLVRPPHPTELACSLRYGMYKNFKKKFSGELPATMPVFLSNDTPASGIDVQPHGFEFYNERFGHSQCQKVTLLRGEMIDAIIVLNCAALFEAIQKTVNINRFNHVT